MELLIVGAGAMGRWFGESVDADVAFSDLDAAAAETAADEVGGRAVSPDADEPFAAVCIAVPMSTATDAIAAHADRATEAIVDVTGAMSDPVAAMGEHAPDVERVSFHPLFAPANAPGNVAVVADEPGPVTDEIRASLVAAGNDLFETSPAEHDEAMSTVQAGAHTAVLAYALAAADVPEQFQTPISAGLLDLVEQVTGNSPRVYSEIQSTFDGAEDVAVAADRIANADRSEFESLYEDARAVAADRGENSMDRETHRTTDTDENRR